MPKTDPNSVRPSRLLNLKKSPAREKGQAVLNATHSPFLKLPAEIRNRIYGYVLGGKVIHVRKPPELGTGPVVCVHPSAPPVRNWPATKDSARIEEVPHQVLGYDQPHQKCHESPLPMKQLSLGLLSVCRQIYHEAVLVPFTDNIFIDDVRVNGPHLRTFLDRLVPIQVKSINHLILNTTQMSLHCASDLNRLSGLKTLEFNLVWRNPQHTTRQEFIDLYEKDLKILNLNKLRLPKLTHMSVSAVEWQRIAFRISHELQQIKKWFWVVISARQEVRLAHSRAGVTRRKAQQIQKLAHRWSFTPHMIQCADKLKRGAVSSRQELQDITTWVESVETRMLNALRLPPRVSDVAIAA